MPLLLTQDAFVDRELLDVKLMHPLVKVLTAPQSRRQSATDDPDDPMEDDEKEDVVRMHSLCSAVVGKGTHFC